jgi:hypothetical protein
MGNWNGGADFAAVGAGLDLRVLAAVFGIAEGLSAISRKNQFGPRRRDSLKLGRSVLRPYVVC